MKTAKILQIVDGCFVVKVTTHSKDGYKYSDDFQLRENGNIEEVYKFINLMNASIEN
jgi:hypothetical protein